MFCCYKYTGEVRSCLKVVNRVSKGHKDSRYNSNVGKEALIFLEWAVGTSLVAIKRRSRYSKYECYSKEAASEP